jgi:hypothetical protein
MSQTFDRIRTLVAEGNVQVSSHGYDELAEDAIVYADILEGIEDAALIEDYPTASKGPSVLLLQHDSAARPVHVVWGIPNGKEGPAVVVTAYRPDPARWSADFRSRKT